MQATASAGADTGPAADYYPRFHAAVALAQLNNWLPPASRLLVDISGPGSRAAEMAAYAGHHVLRVIDAAALPRAVPPQARPVQPPAAEAGPAPAAGSEPRCAPWPPTGPASSSSPTAAPTA